MNNTKRVLHVVSSMNRGGAESMIMNLYRNIDKSKLQFDFVCHIKEKCEFEDEIKSLGGRIIRIDSLGILGLKGYINTIKKVISEYGPFQAVHAHTDIQAGVVTLASKQAGVKIRVCHSHNTKWKEEPGVKDKLQSYILRKVGKITSTSLCACGSEAGKFFFGNTTYKRGKVNILNNGINIDTFINVNQKDVECIKKEFDIDNDTLVIGHIGRFYEQKNHKFLIEIAKQLKCNNIKFKMLLVGKGPLKDDIDKLVKENNLYDEIKFLGVREDIPAILKAFDIFLFPSFYEGLPVTLIETQASGIKAIISDRITDEVDMGLGLIEKISLKDDIDVWIKNIKDRKKIVEPKKIYECITNNGYSAIDNVKNIYNLYKVE